MASDGHLEADPSTDPHREGEPALYEPVYWFTFVLGILFGLVWIYAGILKARDPILFLMDVRSFQLLGDPWAAYLALGLPWLEITCGVCVIARKFYYGALVVLSGLLAVFLGAILSAQSRDLDITCGCFGKSDNATVYSDIIGRDVGLLAVAFLLFGSAWWMARVQRNHR